MFMPLSLIFGTWFSFEWRLILKTENRIIISWLKVTISPSKQLLSFLEAPNAFYFILHCLLLSSWNPKELLTSSRNHFLILDDFSRNVLSSSSTLNLKSTRLFCLVVIMEIPVTVSWVGTPSSWKPCSKYSVLANYVR